MDLIQQLIKDCGVTELQAKAGAGMIFRKAKKSMSPADFAKVSAVVPGIDAMIKASPPIDNQPINATPVLKYVPTILSFVQSKAGDEVKELLDKGIFTQKTDKAEKGLWH